MLEFDAAAIRVRDTLLIASQKLFAGDPGWRAHFDEAVSAAQQCTDTVSRNDAAIRIHQFSQGLALNAGNTDAALEHLNQVLPLLDQQLELGDNPARNNDHRWGVYIARCTVYQRRSDLKRAAADAQRAMDLAPNTLSPNDHVAASHMSLGAVEIMRGNYAAAVQHYQQAVDASREMPNLLPDTVLGLAQAQAQLGLLDESTASLARLEALLVGKPENIDLRAQLLQLRSYIELARNKRDRTPDGFSAKTRAGTEAHRQYSEHIVRHGEHLDYAHLTAAASVRAIAHHSEADYHTAAREADMALAHARSIHDASGEMFALMQLATIRQDLALSTGEQHHHNTSLSYLEQAHELAARIRQPLIMAGNDTEYARYISQWYGTDNYYALPLLEAAMHRASRAAVYFHIRMFDGSLAAERRSYAAQYASDAFEVAAQLAFGTGNKRIVAELIELRASGAVFSSETAAHSTELLATTAPPLLFAPGEVVLASAFADANTTYGLPIDEREPVPTW